MICKDEPLEMMEELFLLNDLVRYDYFGHSLSMMFAIKNDIPLTYEYFFEG
jgi:hypothetical protein